VGKVKNSLSFKSADGWLLEDNQDLPSIDIYGTLEGTVQADVPKSIAKALASVVFAHKAAPEEGATYDIIALDDIPFEKYFPGDWVLAPNDVDVKVPRRIMSISLAEADGNGQPLYTIEFDTIFQDNDARINKILNKSGGGGTGGSFSNAEGIPGIGSPVVVIPNNPPVKVPKAPSGLTITSAGIWSADGVVPQSKATLSWNPVTQNTDGSATVPAFYEVCGRPTAESSDASQSFGQVTTNTVLLGNAFTPGSDWTFEVRAYNDADRKSTFSSPESHIMVGPLVPMDAPDDPTLSSSKGLLLVTSNGLLQGNPPPPQFRNFYPLVSDTVDGTYNVMGAALFGAGTVSIAGLTVGQEYFVKLIAVDGVGILSAASGIASITLMGIDLGDLNESIGEAIDAAKEAGIAARSTINLLEDDSFELNTEEFWDLAPANVTNVATDPRTGLRHLRVEAIGSDYEAFRYQRVLPCDPGEAYYFRIYIKPEASVDGDSQDGGIELSILYGTSESSTPNEAVVGGAASLDEGIYQPVTGTWTAPSDAFFFKPRIMVRDTTSDNVYYLDDIRMYRMTGTSLLVNGSVVTDSLAAEAVTAGKVAADAIAAVNIQAEAITAEKMAADSVTANAIAAGSIETDALGAGVVTTSKLAANVGEGIDISSNTSVTIIAGQISDVQDNVNDTNSNLAEMQTYYTFGVDGAVVAMPGSPFSLALRNDRIEMLENGNVVSYWNSGQMYVSQFVGEKVILGNHQLEKYGTGTVVRSL
jgi:hypothetical protein